MEDLSESGDESFLRWRLSVEDDDQFIEADEYGSEPLLRTVVRTTYLSSLRRNLRKNIEASKQKDNYVVEDSFVNKLIKGCSARLEEKALRNCMIAKLYREMMLQMIKEIKKATSENSLYTPLQEFAVHQSKIPVPIPNVKHQETQTDFGNLMYTSQIADVYNQVEALIQRINPMTQNLDVPRPQNINGLLLHPPQSLAKCTKTLNGILKPESRNFDIPIEEPPAPVDFNDIQEKTVGLKRKNCENLAIFSDDEIAHASSSACTSKPETPLNSLPVVDDLKTSASVKNNLIFQSRLRSATFAETVALWYNLECEIEELPPAKKQKLEEKFVQLFGIDHAVDYYNLTNEQKSIACRKRIAKVVVEELTNFYNKKRVASKDLFKTLAKHITSVLLGRSLYPSPEEIKRSVDEFFSNDRVIKSETDFM